jgi:hypothetical protein
VFYLRIQLFILRYEKQTVRSSNPSPGRQYRKVSSEPWRKPGMRIEVRLLVKSDELLNAAWVVGVVLGWQDA